jgi:hypothetical protein
MAAKDLFHDAVKNGLQRDGWVVTHDPLVIEIDEIRYEIDLGAEELNSNQNEIANWTRFRTLL